MTAILFIVKIQISKVKRKWYSYEKGFRKTGSMTTSSKFLQPSPKRPRIPASLYNLFQRNILVTLGFFKKC